MEEITSAYTEVILLEIDIQNQIYQTRKLNAMLDKYLAALYAVETEQWKRQVRRMLTDSLTPSGSLASASNTGC